MVRDGATRRNQVGGEGSAAIFIGHGGRGISKLWGGCEGVRVKLYVEWKEGKGSMEAFRGDAMGVQEVGGQSGGALGRGRTNGVGKMP